MIVDMSCCKKVRRQQMLQWFVVCFVKQFNVVQSKVNRKQNHAKFNNFGDSIQNPTIKILFQTKQRTEAERIFNIKLINFERIKTCTFMLSSVVQLSVNPPFERDYHQLFVNAHIITNIFKKFKVKRFEVQRN